MCGACSVDLVIAGCRPARKAPFKTPPASLFPDQRGNAPVLEARNVFGRKASRWEASDAVLLFEYMYQATVVTD